MPTPELTLEQKISALKGPILVVGAGGFIGANLLATILKVRKDCYGVVHDSTANWRHHFLAIPKENILLCDILSKQSVTQLYQKTKPQTVFNLAAFGAYPHQADETKIYETNFIGVLNLIEAGGSNTIFIQAGTNSEYGSNSNAPKEGDHLQPNSHYSVSKVATSYLLQYYGTQKQFPCLNLRLYSVYGPWEEPTRLVPNLIERLSQKQLPPLAGAETSRDFVYIDDVVEAFVHAALYIKPELYGTSFNIGTGVQTSLSSLVQAALYLPILAFNEDDLKAPTLQPNWSTYEKRAWDLQQWVSNPEKAQQELGWKAKVKLVEGLTKTYQWQIENNYASTILKAFHQSDPPPVLIPKIAAVISCYKDEQAIPIMYQRLVDVFAKLNVGYEIIFVNDGSPDNTAAVLTEICQKDPQVIAITHSRNFGSQAAFMSGMEMAKADAIVLMDGDLQDPPEMIPLFYNEWQKGNEVVYGKRVKRDAPLIMNLAYKTFYRIFRKLSYIQIPVDAGDFSLIDKKVVHQLLSLPEKDQFIRGLRAWVGYSQIGVPYTRPERMFGKSTNNWRRNLWWAKKAIFSFSYIPLELLSYIGFVLTGISFLAMVAQIIARILNPNLPHGIPTVIVLILFFGGIQLLAVSILGEYLGKVLEETKARPKFIRKSVLYQGKDYSDQQNIQSLINRNR